GVSLMTRCCIGSASPKRARFTPSVVPVGPCWREIMPRQRRPLDSPLRRNRSDGAPRAIGRVMALAGLLAGGSRPLLRLPGHFSQWRIGAGLAAYSCGGSLGGEPSGQPLTCSLFSRPRERRQEPEPCASVARQGCLSRHISFG